MTTATGKNASDESSSNSGGDPTGFAGAWTSLQKLDPTERFDAWLILVFSISMAGIVVSFKEDQSKIYATIFYIVIFLSLISLSMSKASYRNKMSNLNKKEHSLLQDLRGARLNQANQVGYLSNIERSLKSLQEQLRSHDTLPLDLENQINDLLGTVSTNLKISSDAIEITSKAQRVMEIKRPELEDAFKERGF
jgi:hypothetical protein